jgi:hypothetical protein
MLTDDQFSKSITEIDGIFSGRIVGFNREGDALIAAFSGPHQVVLPQRLLNGHAVGDVVSYVCVSAEVSTGNGRARLNQLAVVKRLANTRSN